MTETKPCPLCGRAAVLVSTGAAIQEDVPGGGGAVLGFAGKMLCKNRDGHPDGQPWSEPAGMIPVSEHRMRTVNLYRQQMVATAILELKATLSPAEAAALRQALMAAKEAHDDGLDFKNLRAEARTAIAGVAAQSRAKVRSAVKRVLDECRHVFADPDERVRGEETIEEPLLLAVRIA